jgi:hypothetical protein
MTENQPIDVSPARPAAAPQAHPKELPLQQWEGEGGATPIDSSRAEASTAATTIAGSEVAPPTDQPSRGAVDPDAITERHFFAENDNQPRR